MINFDFDQNLCLTRFYVNYLNSFFSQTHFKLYILKKKKKMNYFSQNLYQTYP